MTTTESINSELSALVLSMTAKGFICPEVTFALKSDDDPYIHMNWRKAGEDFNSYAYGCTQTFMGSSFEDCREKAIAWIDAQPSPEQRRFREFAEILAKAVEFGKQNGIDAVLVNPLEAAMKKLSKNALMFHPSADRSLEPA